MSSSKTVYVCMLREPQFFRILYILDFNIHTYIVFQLDNLEGNKIKKIKTKNN